MCSSDLWDFSVTKENQQVQDMNAMLEQAIARKNYISFDYRNANGDYFHPTVQPLAIHYKWYAWYLFTYEETRQDYRMNHLIIEEKRYEQEHGNIEAGGVRKIEFDRGILYEKYSNRE